MFRVFRQLSAWALMAILCIGLCLKPAVQEVQAEEIDQRSSNVKPVVLTTRSVVGIDRVFGDTQAVVDENIYYSLAAVSASDLKRIFGTKYDTPMFNKALETINPCMAFATTWGEAGASYAGISMTTVMDFNPATYSEEIDWINISANIEQVDSTWYIANARGNYNTNANGKAFHMPVALLQIPRGTDRSTSEMTGLGVGPYQITSSDWNRWVLDNRVNPVWGFEDSLEKCGTSWITCGINPISDLTVYACLSLGHQGGGLIDYPFGKNLINQINRPEVQQAFNEVGYQMYLDLKEKAYSKPVSTANLKLDTYLSQLQQKTGITFSSYTGGAGSTNKGNYVALHCLRYVFYKYYFTSGIGHE